MLFLGAVLESICSMLMHATSFELAEAPVRTSPVNGCGVGSIHMSLHTLVMRFVVKSHLSWWIYHPY